MNFNWNPPQPEPLEVIEEIPCSNPECEHGWDLEMNDVCEECYGAGHYENQKEIDRISAAQLTQDLEKMKEAERKQTG